jgi:hypothetical protein
MAWKCPPLHLPNWNNFWKWKDKMINEHDIADHDCALYELNKGDKFTIVDEVDKSAQYWFGHIDGMYSYCKDPEGNPIHFAAWTKVRKV